MQILLLSYLIDKANSETNQNTEVITGFGLLINTGPIYVQKASINTVVSVHFPSKMDIPLLTTELHKVETEVEKISNMGLLDVEKFSAPLNKSFDAITYELEYIDKILTDMSTYVDESKVHPDQYLCDLKFEVIDLEYIKDIVRGVQSFVSQVDVTVDAAKIALDNKKFEHIISTVILVKEFLTDHKEYLLERLDAMNALTNGFIPSKLIFHLETLPCVSSGDLEDINLNFCDKTKEGLLCELDITAHKNIQEYSRFTPVIYDGVHIRAENSDQKFIRSNNGQWETLTCNDKDESPYDEEKRLGEFSDCISTPYINDCSRNFLTQNYDKILKHCNFTYSESFDPIVRTITGILVQSDEVTVKEIDRTDNHAKTILNFKFPMHITSPDNIAATVGDKEILLKPVRKDVQRKVLYTYLTDEFIEQMKASAKKSDFLTNLETHTIFSFIFVILFAFVLPVTLIMCFLSIKHSNQFLQWKDKRNKKCVRTNKNYCANKRLLRESRV